MPGTRTSVTLQYEGQVEEEESSKQLSSERSQRIRDESHYREVGENIRKHVVTSVKCNKENR